MSEHLPTIDSISTQVKALLDLIEERLGPPPNLSYLSTGYIGPDKFISITTDIDSNLRRAKAIIQFNVRGSVPSTRNK